ncbi:hypothetical protein M2341_001075 [Sphingobium sp. B7D2B]|nr:hypothetical protein [Sphingobium sp. B7D2B]
MIDVYWLNALRGLPSAQLPSLILQAARSA